MQSQGINAGEFNLNTPQAAEKLKILRASIDHGGKSVMMDSINTGFNKVVGF